MEEGVRTPHSVFFYALGYGGWIGAGIFLFLMFALMQCLWKVYKLTGNAFGLSYLMLNLALGLFGNSFETPFGAIPFYLVMGVVIAPLFQTVPQVGAMLPQPAPAQPTSTPAVAGEILSDPPALVRIPR